MDALTYTRSMFSLRFDNLLKYGSIIWGNCHLVGHLRLFPFIGTKK